MLTDNHLQNSTEKMKTGYLTSKFLLFRLEKNSPYDLPAYETLHLRYDNIHRGIVHCAAGSQPCPVLHQDTYNEIHRHLKCLFLKVFRFSVK